eukprot:Opistho-1_new@109300
MTDPIVNLWTAQQLDARGPSVAELTERATRFQRRIRARDLIEYVAGTLVIAAFAGIAVDANDWGIRIASLLLITGTGIAMRNVWRRRSTNDPASLAQDALTHYRARLAAQRDALASVGRWYLAPFLPGTIVFLAAVVRVQAETLSLATALRNGAIATTVIALIFGLILWLNRCASRAITAEIETLAIDPAID